RTAEALESRPADVMLVSHDKDFVPQMEDLAADVERRTAIIGFREFMAADLQEIPGIEVHDLEYDLHAFTSRRPRVRIIEIDEFGALEFIWSASSTVRQHLVDEVDDVGEDLLAVRLVEDLVLRARIGLRARRRAAQRPLALPAGRQGKQTVVLP